MVKRTIDDDFINSLSLGALKKYVLDYFNINFHNTEVINKHKGITISLRKSGVRHVIYARNAGYIKLKAILVIDEIIKNAIFMNFKNPDIEESVDIIGYMNFKSKIQIEGRYHFF